MQCATSSSHDETASEVLAHLANHLRVLADRAALAVGLLPADDLPVGCDGRCNVARLYRSELRAAIVVLEQTRTSFKSRELGALRRRLSDVLERAMMDAPAAEPLP